MRRRVPGGGGRRLEKDLVFKGGEGRGGTGNRGNAKRSKSLTTVGLVGIFV